MMNCIRWCGDVSFEREQGKQKIAEEFVRQEDYQLWSKLCVSLGRVFHFIFLFLKRRKPCHWKTELRETSSQYSSI